MAKQQKSNWLLNKHNLYYLLKNIWRNIRLTVRSAEDWTQPERSLILGGVESWKPDGFLY